MNEPRQREPHRETGRNIFLTDAFALEGEEKFQACLDAFRFEADEVFVASILGDMDEEQRALSHPPVPLEWQTRWQAAIQSATRAPLTFVTAACVSGAAALVLARARLLTGRCARVGVMAFEQNSAFLSAGFDALHCLTDTPAPYTRRRQGFRLTPGFGWLLLSTRPDGERAAIRIAAASSTNDATHLTGPDAEGRGLRRAIEDALRQAGLAPEDLAAIKLNGAGTPYADASEYRALAACFGPRLPNIPCFSLKQQIGHMQGACGVVETLLAAERLRQQSLPPAPVALLDDLEFPLHFPARETPTPMKHMLLLYSGMGGQNAALILTREDAP